MEHEFEKISSDVTCLVQYVIPGCPTNCYIVRSKKNNYIIDTGFGSDSSELIMSRIDPKKPIKVVNTHYHWDHVWGNCFFKGKEIISHRKSAELQKKCFDELLSSKREYTRGEVGKCFPNVTFDGELNFLDDSIQIFSTPGHTVDGISVFYKNEGILFVGDNIGDDAENIVPELETDRAEFIEHLKKCLDFKPEIVLSGHNRPQRAEFLEKIVEILK
ncbi:MBL fold metallo-hydrolase [candidate division WOR-3 bacterium]|nr:MBL fold metallo-hydrolase [candidate division WOR-3 bacterium]